jgi:hypothetical protein
VKDHVKPVVWAEVTVRAEELVAVVIVVNRIVAVVNCWLLTFGLKARGTTDRSSKIDKRILGETRKAVTCYSLSHSAGFRSGIAN